MKKEEVEKRINEIACRVYEVDENEPDPQQFAIEREIEQLLIDLGVKYDSI